MDSALAAKREPIWTPFSARVLEGPVPPKKCDACLKACKHNFCIIRSLIRAQQGDTETGLVFTGERLPDRNEGAHIKAWYHGERNRAKDYVIRRNAFCCAGDMLVQICSGLRNEDGSSSLPTLTDNLFVGRAGGQFGMISDSGNAREAYGPATQATVDAHGTGNRCLFIPDVR